MDERDREQLLTEQHLADSFLSFFDEWRAEHPRERQRPPPGQVRSRAWRGRAEMGG